MEIKIKPKVTRNAIKENTCIMLESAVKTQAQKYLASDKISLSHFCNQMLRTYIYEYEKLHKIKNGFFQQKENLI